MRLIHFVAWRDWGVIRTNPVLENTFVFFYLVLYHRYPLGEIATDLAMLLGLVFFMASYGYLLNDAVDCERDLGHRIPNVFAETRLPVRLAVVLAAMLGMLPFVARLQAHHPLLLGTWLAWFACTSLYSLPGIYLKGRGLIGLVAVALALRTLPIAIVLTIFGRPPDAGWIILLGYLTLRGLSGDLSHQLTDWREDHADGLGTFVVRIGVDRARVLLDRILEAERIALVLTCVWMFGTLTQVRDWPRPIDLMHFAIPCSVTLLTIYAGVELRRGARGHDPHAPEYLVKDVFYLLHKSIPKIGLATYLLALAIAQDPGYLVLAVPLAVYFRLYSVRRVASALRLRPHPRTRELQDPDRTSRLP